MHSSRRSDGLKKLWPLNGFRGGSSRCWVNFSPVSYLLRPSCICKYNTPSNLPYHAQKPKLSIISGCVKVDEHNPDFLFNVYSYSTIQTLK